MLFISFCALKSSITHQINDWGKKINPYSNHFVFYLDSFFFLNFKKEETKSLCKSKISKPEKNLEVNLKIVKQNKMDIFFSLSKNFSSFCKYKKKNVT